MFDQRLRQVISQLSFSDLTGTIISSPANLTYLTGLNLADTTSREAFLFVNHSQAILYHSPLLSPPSLSKLVKPIPMAIKPGLQVIFQQAFFSEGKVSFEAGDLRVAELERFKSIAPQHTFIPTTSIVESMRLTKSEAEIQIIKQASKTTASVMSWVQQILSGMNATDLIGQEVQKALAQGKLTEILLAQLIELHLKLAGADSLAFPVLVAFDQHSAVPHHTPTAKILKPNTVVLLDFGARVQGYCSDMTRTFFYTSPKIANAKSQKTLKQKEFDKVEQAVLNSFKQSVNLLAAEKDIDGQQLDHTARTAITEAGYPSFPHATGHGLGLDIHEDPRISPQSTQELKPGMVITLEPSIYLENKFGYRYEDTLLITKDGYKNLTSPKASG